MARGDSGFLNTELLGEMFNEFQQFSHVVWFVGRNGKWQVWFGVVIYFIFCCCYQCYKRD